MISVRKFAPLSFALITTTTLSGCLGAGTLGGALSGDPAITAGLAAEARAQLLSLGAQAVTMPTSGTAEYKGYASAVVKDTLTDQTGRQLVGDATLTADFGASEISGELANFLAKNDVDQTEFLIAVSSRDADTIQALLDTYDQTSGSLTVSNGQITDAAFTADVAGTIDHDGTAIEFGGNGEGFFQGANGELAQFFAETNEGLTLTEDGATKAGDLAVLAVQ